MAATDGDLWRVDCADCLDWLRALPPRSADLVFGSPPYEAQRTYGIGFDLSGQAWVDWMVEVVRAASAACRGLVAFVVEGFTKDYRWSASPALLMADLYRAGFNLRKPPAYCRVGIPGSGGPDWFRNDYEFVVCVTPPGRLPWSDSTAHGHTPVYGPGGEMSHCTLTGERVNTTLRRAGSGGGGRSRSGVAKSQQAWAKKGYTKPRLANPGNLVKCKVGGGHLGSPLAHENEAAFPELLAERFVRSFAPPGGLVFDPFSGSGTTGAVAVKWGRRFAGCDVRPSQVELSRRRIAGCVGMFDGVNTHT